MEYFCCDRQRRTLLKGTTWNGIDYLEVLDRDAPTEPERQLKLYVHLINSPSAALTEVNFRIEGGERIRHIQVVKVTAGADGDPDGFTVEVDKRGDFSTYTLRIVAGANSDQPPSDFDPQFATVEFSFKVECPSDFDCQPQRICPAEPRAEPEIDYLAKDYASFRQLMLDRLSVLIPQWRERNPADLGIALVEMLAYVGDHLSYQQDATITEAYLGTARRRVSVRRHARLVDYFMHEGCNARAWVQVQVNEAGPIPLSKRTRLLSRLAQQPPVLDDKSFEDALKRQRPVVFETMHDAVFFKAHNEIRFYTWGDRQCCLPKGATRATLVDDPGGRLRLRVGDILLFEERLGPNTGREPDADPTHRHAVRLTRVEPEADKKRNAGTLLEDKIPVNPQAIVKIEWDTEDALPFALCLSGTSDEEHGAEPLVDVSVARGNIVLADHGLSLGKEPLGTVPKSHLSRPRAAGPDRCQRTDPERVPARFRAALKQRPLTHAAPFAFPPASAEAAMRWTLDDPELLPAISLESELGGANEDWTPRRELLGREEDRHGFVVEIESDGVAWVRFGSELKEDTSFTSKYRVGNGTAGNLGAESLAHVVTNENAISAVRNPLPARGGSEPESIEETRQRAPTAFRTQKRAVTEEDYAEVTQRDPRVQRAAATFRWTGSWHTVFLTVDRLGGLEVDEEFDREMVKHVDRFRMAGHDLEVDAPHFVSLEIEMHVCVKPGYFRSDVRAALLALFSNRTLPDGTRGLFHPDRFTFGQTVFLSPLYAAAQAVAGVASVQITRFQRADAPDPVPLAAGRLPLGRLEIARLDNDPNFAERGVFRLTMGGGK